MWTVGLALGGHYRLDALLGTDPVTGVWAATHTPSGRRVALRRLPAAPELGPAEVARVVEEIRYASAVEHVNVAPTYDVLLGVAEAPVVVSALLVGETLAELLARTPMLSLEQTASLLLPAVSAVGTAHARGIVHGRLSSSSIFIADPAGALRVSVLDFGVGKWFAALQPAPTSARGALGAVRRSSDYSPPEGVLPGRSLDHRADIWAIGVIVYECLSGLRPADFVPPEQAFLAESAALVPIERHVPGLPRALTDAIADLVVADPEHRAQNLIEFFNLLGPFAEQASPSFGWPGSQRRITGLTRGIPALARVEPPAPPARAKIKRSPPGWRALALVASALALAELALLAVLVLRLQRSEAQLARAARGAPVAEVVEVVEATALADAAPRSASMTLRATPLAAALLIDDFEGAGDAPAQAAFGPWQAFASSGLPLPLGRGPGYHGAQGLEMRLPEAEGSASGSVASVAAPVRGGVVNLSEYQAITFAHRIDPLPTPGLACQGPAGLVGFVSCRPAPEAVPRRLELALPVSRAWSSAALPFGALRLPEGGEPTAGERSACLSAVDALGFRVERADGDPESCGGTLSIDDVTLR